jgi:acetyl-CoA acetyltransferase
VARVTALRAGIPEPVPAATVHRNCASGMEAVATAAHRIGAGDARLVLAGGTESMSQMPLLYTSEYAAWLESLMRAKNGLQKAAVLSRFSRPGRMAGELKWVHNMAIDSKGNLYTAEVGTGRRAQKFLRVQ